MTNNSFTALDFETAQSDPSSICQVGLIRVEDGEVIHQYEQLVRPPKNYYFHKNIEVHHIRPMDTEHAPTFDQIWPEITQYIEGQVVVAHNIQFDANCLRQTLAFYDEVQPDFEERCTRMIYRRGLAYLCKKYRIPLDHHNALSDAHACAQLYLKHLRRLSLPKTGSLFPDY